MTLSFMGTGQRMELLAPAGNRECIAAAIENGADAVYFGLQSGFNARARATNLAIDDAEEIFAQLHRRGVRGYVTLNTLVFMDELPAFEENVRRLAHAGADAVLVQDVGAARLIRAVCPDLPIHASTQMTLSSAETIRLAEQIGMQRVVLARELSIDEIRDIAQHSSMELEAFAHGALCVAYSGQCLTSESLGGRSANRGQCAQACRLPYELFCDGQHVDTDNRKYLLSPQDLAAIDLVPQLMEAGVTSLKIEGRLKTPEYVANVTRHYRQAIDAAVSGRPHYVTTQQRDELQLSFSRGFSPGWLQGCDHKMLVPADSSSKRGILIGRIDSVRKDAVRVILQKDVVAGDGVVFDGDRLAGNEQGGRVYSVRTLRESAGSRLVELRFGHNAIDFRQLYAEQRLWKTDDPQLTKRLRKSFGGIRPVSKQPIVLHVAAEPNKELKVDVRWADQQLTLVSEMPLQVAKKHPVSQTQLEEQFGRLGNSAYELIELTAKIVGEPMVPLSVLGALRKEMLRRLDEASTQVAKRTIVNETVLPQLFPTNNNDAMLTNSSDIETGKLVVLCRNLPQLQAVLELGERDVAVEFQDIRQYRQARTMATENGTTLSIATPRIQKPGEMWIFDKIGAHSPDEVLVRNFSGLQYFQNAGLPVVADFSFNVANSLTADYFMSLGVERVTASYDLNRDQLLDLVRSAPPTWFEVVIHQQMPMFHMEHCVFCAMLSPGTNKTNCGRPCDRHVVQLEDRVGMRHTLTADIGCRNTLYNAQAQSGAEAVSTLQDVGIRNFRVELLDQSDVSQIQQTVRLYRQLLERTIRAADVWSQLNAQNRIGVTRGSLEAKRDPLAIL
ncbi:MAG: DUF3656 domain-containing protein [Pirellulaceae bacterium]